MVAIRHDLGSAMATLADHRRPEAERARAAVHLGESGDPQAVLALAFEYGDSSGSLRNAVSYALGRLNGVEVLARQLAFADPVSRAKAAEVLALFSDERATRALALALTDPEEAVRINAACALVEHASPLALESLVKRLETDCSRKVRAASAQAIGVIPTPAAREALEVATRAETDVFVVILIERAIQKRIDEGEPALG
jgi:HEAT repeat protein